MKDVRLIEKEADQKASELKIWDQSAHLILSSLYNLIYELYYFEGEGHLEKRFKAERMISCLSGVAHYLSSCSDKVLKITEAGLVEFSEGMKDDIGNVIEYGQLCTIMDRVHKGDFVEDYSGDIPCLNFGGEERFTLEARDVLISELSLPNIIQPKQFFDPSFTFELGAGAAFFSPGRVAEQVAGQRKELEGNIADIDYLDDFSDVIADLSSNEFKALKSSAIALAFYCRSVSRILLEAIAKGLISGPKANSRVVYWKSPCLKKSDVVSVLSKAAEVPVEKAHSFVEAFTLTIGEQCPKWVKGGYFPPFQQLGDRLVFCPAVLLSMMTNRNAIYLCSKLQEKTFHEIVSARMEPKLVDDFLIRVPEKKGWIFEKSVNFADGEIDLVGYNEKLNIALQIQAKGSIAPEGAVLVRNFESRCQEGIAQLEKFESLGSEEATKALQKRFPALRSDTKIIPVLLARSSFGRPDFLGSGPIDFHRVV